ncbi:MAG TPA: lysylphosphatidylglycerol synthase transmembrane domain-containing protein, partial [Candidatus Sulfomarinibacteraceae bacterium]|nr:lysylphosphatidylglycerol synthase transmembrane domain-containing protein [Candidatus Sulfomarinibacteraceae bacterium]
RVQLILQAQKINFPYRWLWLLQLRGTFILSFIPGKVSGDLYRGYAIGRDADRHLDSMTAVLLERVIGLAALILVSVSSLFLAVYALELTTYTRMLQPATVLAGAVLVATLLAFVIIRRKLISRLQLPIPLWNRVQQLAEQLYLLFSDNRILGGLGFLSVLLQIAVILWYFVIARAMQLDISLITLMVSVPVVELLVTIPISIGGIGVRESAMVFLLLPFGVVPEDAISLSLLVAITATIAGTLAGLSFFVTLPHQVSKQTPALDHHHPPEQ